jgi:hypothetical membrane protein
MFLFLALISGILASVFIPAIILGLLVSSPIDFSDLTSLSQLGERGSENAWVFNSTLIVGGILLLVFAIGLAKNYSLNGRLAVGVFAFSSLFLIFVGIFNIPHSFHNLSAVLFFGSLPTSLLIIGQNVIRLSKKQNLDKSFKLHGYGTLASGLSMWSMNLLMMFTFSTIHITIFELVITFISSFWLIVFGRKLL